MAKSILTTLAQFSHDATDASFPALARSRAVDAVTDCIGCMIAGAGEPAAVKLKGVLPILSKPSGRLSSVVSGGGYASAADAAFCNGTASHALDYDDTNHPAYAHPSAVIVPALLALAPLAELRGKDLITAYIVGFELMGKLGHALNTTHYAKGWHPTSTFGALCSALACSRMLSLSVRQTEIALAIAASEASGLRANFGTMVKPLHAGHASRAGLIAALLAQNGYDGSLEALEHRFGYLAAFSGETPAKLAALEQPGKDLEILTEFGLALKPYPACGATHPGIEAACGVHEWLKGRRPKQVYVGISLMAKNPLIYDSPTTPLEGKFSMQYCAAAALLDGVVNLQTFTAPNIARSDIKDMLGRMTVDIDDRVRESPEFGTAVRVDMEDGESKEILVKFAKGKPERWFSEQEIHDKYLDCLNYSGIEPLNDGLFQGLRKLDSEASLQSISDELSRISSLQPVRNLAR